MLTHLLLMFLSWPGASGDAGGTIPVDSAQVQLLRADGDVLTVKWDSARVRQLHQTKPRFMVQGIPISATERVDLELTPFSVAGPGTRFVVGHKDAPDEPFVFDTSRVQAFRGSVTGQAGSDVFVVFGDAQTTGYIDLGAGRNRFLLSSKDKNGLPLPQGVTSVFPAGSVSGYQPPVPLCGVDDRFLSALGQPALDASVSYTGSQPARDIRHTELAVETDFEYFKLFGDRGAATEYLVQMYAQVSHIFLRDAMVHFELVHVKLQDEPFLPIKRGLDDGRLGDGSLDRPVLFDMAQFVSGRRDAPYGGIAFDGLCSFGVASQVFYIQGAFPDPTMPSPYHYDIFVAAHELGHNACAPHTHNVGIDNCDRSSGVPQRGTIMSYCQQSYSGLNANQDFYFHRLISDRMIGCIQNAACMVIDCNLNNHDDALDILRGSSADVDGNGVPDECEDCNGNGVLDHRDLASQTSNDINANGVPDECEPDCNGNDIPDSMDIVDGTSSDLYGNTVPDECETDCNGNGVSDYTEIQGDMSKDVDRNAALDECQDCDNDGTTDHAALNGAHNLWIVSGLPTAPLREYFATTGVLVQASAGPAVSEGQDVVIAPDGRILVSSAGTNRIQAFDRNATFIEDLVPPGTSGMNHPTGMVVLSDDRLLVASRDSDNILAFDVTTGAPLGTFVSAGSGGLSQPHGMTVGPNGNLFVASESNEIIEYDGQNGSFVRVLVNASANGGLMQPRDLVFKRDGQLLVTSFGTDEVLAYDGQSGAPIGSWAVLGFAVSGMTPVEPWGIEIGPNGNVFVSRAQSALRSGSDAGGTGEALHLSSARVFEYDVCNGNFVRVYVGGGDLDLVFPTGFAFVPGWDLDCNFNLVPDDCDIASGASFDLNGSQMPDECEIDCNGNGRLDRLDVIPFGPSLDCNNNLLPDGCDIAAGTSTDCDGSGVPDECEPDCNGIVPIDSCGFDAGSAVDCDGNGQPDSCEIFEATAADCNANCVPDVCDPDCNGNGLPDECDIVGGSSDDCNVNGVPDDCDIDSGFSGDCDGNGLPDECELQFRGARYAAGRWPSSIAIGDLNGNRVPDLVVANASSDNVSVLRGIGHGRFDSRVDYAAGRRPSSVAIGDLNGDQVLELAVANASSDNVSVLLGVGDGTLAPVVSYAVGDGPQSVAIGDLNGDRVPDLAVANSHSHNVSVLPGVGDGTFASAVNYAAGNGPRSVAIGDLNGDQVPDLAVANYFSDNVSVRYSVGDGTCVATAYYAAGRLPNSVTIGDLDRDGEPDLVVANATFRDDNVSVLLNRSGGCNDNGIPDDCDIDCGPPGGACDRPGCGRSEDCNQNGVPDACDIESGDSADCNCNEVIDACEIDAFMLVDCTGATRPCDDGPFFCTGDCEPDVNINGIPDCCDVDMPPFFCPDCCGFADLDSVVFADVDTASPFGFDPPHNCAIDAREPHGMGHAAARRGWDRMAMSFSCDPRVMDLVPGDFVVSVVPDGAAPAVSGIAIDSLALTVTVILDDKMMPGQWTCIAHPDSGHQWCAGYLPADANQDGVSTAGDINALIDEINRAVEHRLPTYATDMDRSGLTKVADILRLIDLLNGAADFDPWIARSLPPCPTPDQATGSR